MASNFVRIRDAVTGAATNKIIRAVKPAGSNVPPPKPPATPASASVMDALGSNPAALIGLGLVVYLVVRLTK